MPISDIKYAFHHSNIIHKHFCHTYFIYDKDEEFK